MQFCCIPDANTLTHAQPGVHNNPQAFFSIFCSHQLNSACCGHATTQLLDSHLIGLVKYNPITSAFVKDVASLSLLLKSWVFFLVVSVPLQTLLHLLLHSIKQSHQSSDSRIFMTYHLRTISYLPARKVHPQQLRAIFSETLLCFSSGAFHEWKELLANLCVTV